MVIGIVLKAIRKERGFDGGQNTLWRTQRVDVGAEIKNFVTVDPPATGCFVDSPSVNGRRGVLGLVRFDRNEFAKTYAKLLLDDGRVGNSLGLQFTIGVANGSVTLSGQSHGIDDLPLGTVGQLYAPAAPR